jgi:hypothetical protein
MKPRQYTALAGAYFTRILHESLAKFIIATLASGIHCLRCFPIWWGLVSGRINFQLMGMQQAGKQAGSSEIAAADE